MAEKKARIIEEDGCSVRMVHLDRVEKARKNASNDRTIDRLSMIYKVLGDPTRLKVVLALRNGEMCVCDLAAFIGIGESAISHQLRQLRNQCLVKTRRDAQILYYSLDDEHVEQLLEIGLDHINE